MNAPKTAFQFEFKAHTILVRYNFEMYIGITAKTQ